MKRQSKRAQSLRQTGWVWRGADGGLYLGDLYARSPVWAAAALVVYVVAALAVSSLTFRSVEKPARRYFNDLAAKKSRAKQARKPFQPTAQGAETGMAM